MHNCFSTSAHAGIEGASMGVVTTVKGALNDRMKCAWNKSLAQAFRAS